MKLKVRANDGLVLVYRTQGQRYNPHYNSTCKHSGHVSVRCWLLISHEQAGVLHHTEGQLDGLHYQHILQNVMVPSYPDGIIHLQQAHSSMILVWFKNGYHSRPMSNSLTGHREGLI